MNIALKVSIYVNKQGYIEKPTLNYVNLKEIVTNFAGVSNNVPTKFIINRKHTQ